MLHMWCKRAHEHARTPTATHSKAQQIVYYDAACKLSAVHNACAYVAVTTTCNTLDYGPVLQQTYMPWMHAHTPLREHSNTETFTRTNSHAHTHTHTRPTHDTMLSRRTNTRQHHSTDRRSTTYTQPGAHSPDPSLHLVQGTGNTRQNRRYKQNWRFKAKHAVQLTGSITSSSANHTGNLL